MSTTEGFLPDAELIVLSITPIGRDSTFTANENIDKFNKALEKMIEIAGMHIDFIADRGSSEDMLQKKLAILCAYNQKEGTSIRYCNTEWLPLGGADCYNFVARSETKVTKCYLFSKWLYALNAAGMLMTWQRYGQDIDFINFNNLANTHSQSVIETPKEGAYITSAGMMMHRFATTEAYQTLVLEDYHAKRTDPVQVQLSVNRDSSALVLNILNRSEEDGEVELDLTAFSTADGEARGVLLAADSLLSMNTLNDTQVAESPDTVTVQGGAVKATVKGLSFGEYIIPLTP